jgi:hypothetical protein
MELFRITEVVLSLLSPLAYQALSPGIAYPIGLITSPFMGQGSMTNIGLQTFLSCC